MRPRRALGVSNSTTRRASSRNDPDTLQIMGVAFDFAWYKLLVSGSAVTASWRAEHTREALALQIVASARLGEGDVGRLCEDALAHAQKIRLSSRPRRSPERSEKTWPGVRPESYPWRAP